MNNFSEKVHIEKISIASLRLSFFLPFLGESKKISRDKSGTISLVRPDVPPTDMQLIQTRYLYILYRSSWDRNTFAEYRHDICQISLDRKHPPLKRTSLPPPCSRTPAAVKHHFSYPDPRNIHRRRVTSSTLDVDNVLR